MSQATKIGPWGGPGGQPRDLRRPPNPSRLKRVIVSSREAIYSIKFTYVDVNGKQLDEGPWGGHGGARQPAVELDDDEYIKEISGTVGPWANVARVITSLKFVTSKDETYEYGQARGTPFEVPIEEGQIVGFFGRDGDLLDAIGIYVGVGV